MTLICFSHGKESGPVGTKIIALSNVAESLGFETLSIDYRGIDKVQNRVQKLLQTLKDVGQDIILVGSSMGAYVSVVASQSLKPKSLFLMAPAVYMPGYEKVDLTPGTEQVFVIHGWHDEIVPCDNALRFAQQYHCDLYLCNDSHNLAGSVDLLEQQFRNLLIKSSI